jgi:hypothetical protein
VRATRAKAHAKPEVMAHYHAGQWPHFGPGLTTEAPTFQSIAERSPEAIDALRAFLMDPHPPMPDLSLTRQEIRDLLSYIDSLR